MDAGIVLAVLSMLAFGLNGGVSKKVVKNLGPLKYALYRNIALTFVLVILCAVNYASLNFDIRYILYALVISVFIYIGFFVSNKAIQKGRLGIVLPITSSRIMITTLLASVILKETLHPSQYLLILMIIGGIVTLSVDFKDLKRFDINGKGIKEAMIAAAIFGITMTFYGEIGKVIGPYLLGLMVEGVILAGTIIQLIISKEAMRLSVYEKKTYSLSLILIAIFSGLGVYFSNLAYVSGSVSIITAILAASPIVTTLYDRFIHKEVMNLQENFGTMIIFAGIIVLSLTKS